jgi:hypothetical protein
MDWKIIQAHRHPGILLQARCRLAFAWLLIVSSGARSCRARSFTACCWLVVVSSLLCCCTLPLLLPAPVLLLSFYILPSRIHSLLGLFTHSITHSLPRHTYTPRQYSQPAFLCHPRHCQGHEYQHASPLLGRTVQSPDSPALHIAPPIAFHHPRTDFHNSAPRATVKPNSTTSRS